MHSTPHLDGLLHIVEVLPVSEVRRQPDAGAEGQVLLHSQHGVHDVILQQGGQGQAECGLCDECCNAC